MAARPECRPRSRRRRRRRFLGSCCLLSGGGVPETDRTEFGAEAVEGMVCGVPRMVAHEASVKRGYLAKHSNREKPLENGRNIRSAPRIDLPVNPRAQ